MRPRRVVQERIPLGFEGAKPLAGVPGAGPRPPAARSGTHTQAHPAAQGRIYRLPRPAGRAALRPYSNTGALAGFSARFVFRSGCSGRKSTTSVSAAATSQIAYE